MEFAQVVRQIPAEEFERNVRRDEFNRKRQASKHRPKPREYGPADKLNGIKGLDKLKAGHG